MNKIWKFVAVPRTPRSCYAWRWQEENGGRTTRESAREFDLYFDCLRDAREHGYQGAAPRPIRGGAVGESKPVAKRSR